MLYALIRNNLIEHVIVAEETFLSLIEEKYDVILDVTHIEPRPSAGDTYYPHNNSFIKNNINYISFNTDLNQDHLQQGTEEGFDSLKLSQYTVSCKDGLVIMDCKKLSAASLLDALHKFLYEDKEHVEQFVSSDNGPGWGKFNITWDDAEKLYEALKKVKL